MARSRNIKPGFFKNEDLAECSLAARFLFEGLWILADRDGLLEDRPKRIKAEIFPFDPYDADELLAELASHGFIVRYEVDGRKCIWVKNFKKHQRPHPHEAASALPACPLNVTASPLHDTSSCASTSSSLNADSLLSESLQSESLEPLQGQGDQQADQSESACEETQAFLDAWNASPGVCVVKQIGAARMKKLCARLRDSPWRESWRAAIAKFPLKCFEGPDAWKPNIEWFLRPDTVTAILEGKYDWKKSNGKQPQQPGAGQRYQPGRKLGEI